MIMTRLRQVELITYSLKLGDGPPSTFQITMIPSPVYASPGIPGSLPCYIHLTIAQHLIYATPGIY